MSHGLQVWSSSSQLLLDVDSKLCRLHAVVTVSYPQGTMNGLIQVYPSGFYAVSGMADDGNWFVYAPATGGPVYGLAKLWIKIESGGFSWQVGDEALISVGGGHFVTAAGSEQVTIMRLL